MSFFNDIWPPLQMELQTNTMYGRLMIYRVSNMFV
jgi:hypothetical protein